MAEGTEVARSNAGGGRIVVVQGDLTQQHVDALVNAANERLAHGGGVAAALVAGGGPRVQEESDRWVAEHGEVGPGEAAVTTAGALPAERIVHVVGPRYRDGQDNERLLREAVEAALAAAADHRSRSVALPAVSAGIFGYPRGEATRVIAGVCRAWLAEHAGPLEEIRLVGFDDATARDFATALGD